LRRIRFEATTAVPNSDNSAKESKPIIPIKSKSSLHVFPNPAKDYLTLRFDPHKVDKEATIQIWSGNGRLVHNEKRMIVAGEEELRLDGLTLPNGAYTVQLHRQPFLKAAKFVVYN